MNFIIKLRNKSNAVYLLRKAVNYQDIYFSHVALAFGQTECFTVSRAINQVTWLRFKVIR